MSIPAAVKVLGDLCLLFSAASTANCWQGSPAALLAPPLLCALAVALGCGEKRPAALRALTLLLPLAGLYWATDYLRLAVTAAAIAYTALVVISNRARLEYGSYCEYFTVGLIAAVVSFFLSLIFGTWRPTLLFSGLYAFCGVYLTRQLRLGRSQTPLSQLLNLGALAGVTGLGAALLAAVLALSKLGFILGWIWDKVANLLVMILWGIAIVFGWLWQGLMNLLSLLGIRKEQESFVLDGSAITVNDSPYFEPVETDPTVFCVLLAVGLTALGIWLARRAMAQMHRRETKPAARAVTLEKLDAAPILPRFTAGSPRDKVRQSYRRFLRLLQKRGAQLNSSQTTQEMHRCGGETARSGQAHRLRALYLTARYNDSATLTARDVREAKELLKELEKTS